MAAVHVVAAHEPNSRRVIAELQQLAGLAVEFAADGFERTEPHGLGFAGGEYVEVRRRDADALGKLLLGHPALCQNAVEMDAYGHGGQLKP